MEGVVTLSDPAAQILEGLNQRQREAVTFEKGPLLIIAGAGTGKTNVITRRIAYLITKHLAEPDEILALTYTEKAAAEMEDRVDKLVPYGYAPVWISTFHAFGDRILRRHSIELGLPMHFDVLDELQQKIFLLENLWQIPLKHYRPSNDPTGFLDELLRLFSRAKDEGVAPEDYLAYCNEGAFADASERARHFEIARCFQTYQEMMRQKGFLDFGDQVSLTVRLFQKEPRLLDEYCKKFKYILVDEFQDTNYIQFQLLQMLTAGDRNITVVGDDDQSIYRFRGASLSNIMKFSDTYPDVHKVVLIENYRSGQKILDAAYSLIQFNNPDRLEFKHGLDKRLTGRTNPDSYLAYRRYETVEMEADEMAKEILRLVNEKGVLYSEIAVLVRKNLLAEKYLNAFRYHGIPAQFAAHQRFFRRPEVLWLASFVHVICDPQDSVHLFNLLSSPFYNLPPIDLALLSGQSKSTNRSLYETIHRRVSLRLKSEISEEGEKTLRRFLRDLQTFAEKSRTMRTGELLYDFLESTGYLKRLVRQEFPDSDEIARNLSRFFGHVRAFSRAARRDDLQSFGDHLTRLHDLGEDSVFSDVDPNENKVQVMTVHKAKGLEFRVLFLPGLIQQYFPQPERRPLLDLPDGLIQEGSLPRQDHRQEERRLFYVALTRAKDRLYLSSAEDYGTIQKRKMSQFVAEALDLGKRDIELTRANTFNALQLFAPPKNPLVEINLPPLKPDEILNLSYNQVDDIQSCPLKYKLNHIFRVPVRPVHHLVLGIALHQAIQGLLMLKKDGKLPFWNLVADEYERAWVSEGFLSREHEEQRKEEGLQSLKKFYDREVLDPVVPFLIEEEFSFLHKQIRIRGRWDRVDFDGKRAVVIDYKSSNIQDQEKADERGKNSLQLYIYAMAFQQRYEVWPEAMELRFIDSGLISHVEFNQGELSDALGVIEKAAENIRRREFQPTPSYNTCRFCRVRQICPVSAY